MSAVASQKKLKGTIFMAVKSRSVQYQILFVGISFVSCGIIIMLVVLFLMVDDGPAGVHLFLGAMGLIAVIIGIDILAHTWPKMGHESILVDLTSARLLEGGRQKKEFPFKDRVRIGVSFNYGFHVPDLKPLYGIQFEMDGDLINVSPSEGYDLDYVKRLWPIALAITRIYELEPTELAKKNLKYQKDKGGYWAKIHDEFLGKEEKIVDKANGPRK